MSKIAQTPAPIDTAVKAKQADSASKRLASHFYHQPIRTKAQIPLSCLARPRPGRNVETGTAPQFNQAPTLNQANLFPPYHLHRSPRSQPQPHIPKMVPRIHTYRPLLRLAHRQIPAQPRPNLIAAVAFSTSQSTQNQPPPPPPPPPSQTPSEPLPETIHISDASTPPPPEPLITKTIPNRRPNRRRLISRLLFAGTFLLLGTIGGSTLRLFISPPTPPTPDTDQDKYVISDLHSQASRLPIVQQLSSNPAWTSWEAYNTLPPSHRAQHITAHTLRGSRGVGGYQRIFHNASTGELVSVIFFGPATIGWPGVVHGGCLATILDESCGRAAFKQWGGLAGVTAKLNIEYKKATLANGFYIIRVRPRTEEELPERERGKRHYKSWVDAVIEDPATGHVTVKAEALFVGGKGNGKGEGEKKFSWGGKVQDAHAEF
ncbi:hypothetical protein QC763_115250 [Podospora pseudopauciseta]|uniref:Thioesterase domain-containing protein n=1 Tax=Podospora pseudopauciseta TaxID=2093780 RepID=A0ABR0I0V2_9PEZI|nr:hypothetical protein QC763_115250 [Podospora pseudopauciseta]